MSKYLLEIGTEELPANFSHFVLDQFKSLIEFEFKKNLIKYDVVICTSTPRRIVLFLEGLVDYADDKKIIRKGPKVSSAFLNGNPTNAAKGFANSLGINVDDLEIKKTDRGEFVFGSKIEKGESTKTSLSSIIPKVIKNLQGPRFMRWGKGNFKFSRPIRWIVSLYNDEILDFAIDECDPNILLSNKSRSHRLVNKVLEVRNPDNYFELMNRNGVIVDRIVRKDKIASLISKSSESLDLIPDLSENLLNEITDLVESPDLIIGKFSEEFLDLPFEVLSTVMKNHQRYVPLLQKDNKFSKLDLRSEKIISTYFFIISNGLKESKNFITKGNEKVLKARFSDAKFFVESDKSVTSKERNEKLKSVSYLKGFGTVFQRVERLTVVAKKVLENLDDKSLDSQKILEASLFCKNDLSSEIVYEFPELQGIMGGKYLKHEGYSEEVCLAVAEHYLPSFYKDSLPSTKYGAIVSISDKIETLLSIFISGKRPSGSSDPYALRRNLNGVIKIIWDFELHLSLENIFEDLIGFWNISLPNLKFNKSEVLNDLNEFLIQRVVSHLEEISLDKKLIKSICTSDEFSKKRLLNIFDLKNRLNSLDIFMKEGSFNKVKMVINRFCKLSSNGNLKTDVLFIEDHVNPDLFEKECESKVHKFIRELESLSLSRNCYYLKLLKLFITHAEDLEEFFDNENGVLVMSDNKEIKNNRLNLISIVRNYSLMIADFTLL